MRKIKDIIYNDKLPKKVKENKIKLYCVPEEKTKFPVVSANTNTGVIVANEDFYLFSELFKKITLRQDSLNKFMCGDDYATTLLNINLENKNIRYGNALISEANELLDSTDWKHWKFSEKDSENIPTEYIDLIHFLTSALIVSITKSNLILEGLSTTMEENILDDDGRVFESNVTIPIWYAIHDAELYADKDQIEINENLDHLNVVNVITKLGSMMNGSPVYNNDFDDYELAEKDILFLIITSLGLVFRNLMLYCDKTLDEVYASYIVKNTLNEFRMNHGYKDGTYIKNWVCDVDIETGDFYPDQERAIASSFEDNVVASRLAKNLPSGFGPEHLTKELEEIYSKLVLKLPEERR